MSREGIGVALAVLILLPHLAAGAWWARSRRMGPVLAVNAAMSLVVLALMAPHLSSRAAPPGPAQLAPAVLELGVLAASAAAVRGGRAVRALSWAGFGIHACMGLAGVVFALAFGLI